MDKQTKTWIVIIGGTILIVIGFSLIFKFWQTAIVGAVGFGFGYFLGVKKRKGSTKK